MGIGRWYPNSTLLWDIPGPYLGQDKNCRPMYGEGTVETAQLWLEMNVSITPLNAEPWDDDNSSEFMRLNLSGRFLTPLGHPARWPESLNLQKVARLNYAFSTTLQIVEAPCYIFPVGTLGLRRPQRRHGDGIRIQARVKPKFLAQASYVKGE